MSLTVEHAAVGELYRFQNGVSATLFFPACALWYTFIAISLVFSRRTCCICMCITIVTITIYRITIRIVFDVVITTRWFCRSAAGCGGEGTTERGKR